MKIIETIILIWGIAYFFAAFCMCNRQANQEAYKKEENARINRLNKLYGRDKND